MKSSTKILIGATLVAIAILIICQLASASFITHSKNTKSSTYDKRTSAQKYYYSYAPAVDSSSFRYKQVYNAVDYPKENNYSYSYYYAPRYNSNTQSYNWRF